jgi:hypothetical protein
MKIMTSDGKIWDITLAPPPRTSSAGLKQGTARIKEIAATRVRYGYRRIHVLLRREGWRVNPKRVYRLYREMGLQLRNKVPKRWVKAKLREDRQPAMQANETWAMDFVQMHQMVQQRGQFGQGDSMIGLHPLQSIDRHFREQCVVWVLHHYDPSSLLKGPQARCSIAERSGEHDPDGASSAANRDRPERGVNGWPAVILPWPLAEHEAIILEQKMTVGWRNFCGEREFVQPRGAGRDRERVCHRSAV